MAFLLCGSSHGWLKAFSKIVSIIEVRLTACTLLRISFGAVLALPWLFSCVNSSMLQHGLGSGESHMTNVTFRNFVCTEKDNVKAILK
jgi:hypothetical protein